MFLENDFPPDPRVENEAMSLIKAGHKVYLFSLSYKRVSPSREIINGINVFRYRAGALTYKLSALVYTFPFFRWLIAPHIRDFVKDVQPDVLHVHDMVLAEAVLGVNSDQLPVVLDLHENRPAIMKYYKHTNTLPGKFLIDLKKWERKQNELINRCQFTICVTEQAIDHYSSSLRLARERFIPVPNTTNLDVFLGYGTDKEIVRRFRDDFVILYLGDTGLRRGLFTAIEAIPEILEKIPHAKLVIVGNSSADNILKEKVDDLGITAAVLFEGWQDVSFFPSYIEASSICISPLHRNLHHDTTYANKIFQYMAVGRPMVVSNCPPQANVVKGLNIGLVHQSENAREFADCIISLGENQALQKEIARRAKEATKDFWNWEKTSSTLVALYDRL